MPSFLRASRRMLAPSLVAGLLLSSVATASAPPAEAPSGDAELICHTDDASECYPQIFVPTDEFQVVHDDQDVPPGLHMRLDMQTGQKVAKLNIPDEVNPALEGLPVDNSVVTVDQEEAEEATPKVEIPKGAPIYEPIGAVKEPPEQNPNFWEALTIIKNQAEGRDFDRVAKLDPALLEVEELSHDMYYGLKIAEDAKALEALFCLLVERDAAQAATRPVTERTDFMASLILSSSVRNHPPALQAVEKAWDGIMAKQCRLPASDAASKSVRELFYHKLAPTAASSGSSGSEAEQAEAMTARLQLPVLGGLLRSPAIRGDFMRAEGMQTLLRILLTRGEAWAPRRAKAARIVADTWLDADVGAAVGTWPRGAAARDPAASCAVADAPATALGQACWEYHLERTAPADAEWSRPLLKLLKAARAARGSGGGGENSQQHGEEL